MRSAALVLLAIALVAATGAPGDEYFGKMKMSALRIRYEFMQLRPRYETHQLLPEQAEHIAHLAEDAYYAWAAAYPKDPWLASTGSLMAGIFEELPGSTAHASAVRALKFVGAHFQGTTYAKKAAADLHRGPPIVADPLWAERMRSATATPSAPVSPGASASPNPSASPSASASPSPV